MIPISDESVSASDAEIAQKKPTGLLKSSATVPASALPRMLPVPRSACLTLARLPAPKTVPSSATPVRDKYDLLQALGFEEVNTIQDSVKDETLSEEEQKILEILREPLPKDELIRALAIPTDKANIVLSVLEIKGLIAESMGEIRRI
jgi:hypothetical protein